MTILINGSKESGKKIKKKKRLVIFNFNKCQNHSLKYKH